MPLPIVAADLSVVPIDVPQLVAVSMSMLFLLIPAVGLTIRFAARPLVEALSKLGFGQQDGKLSTSELERLSRRVLELEQEVARLKGRTAAGLAVGLEDSLPVRRAEQLR